MTKNEILATALSIGRSIERDIWPCPLEDAQAFVARELTDRAIPEEWQQVIRILALQHVIAGR